MPNKVKLRVIFLLNFFFAHFIQRNHSFGRIHFGSPCSNIFVSTLCRCALRSKCLCSHAHVPGRDCFPELWLATSQGFPANARVSRQNHESTRHSKRNNNHHTCRWQSWTKESKRDTQLDTKWDSKQASKQTDQQPALHIHNKPVATYNLNVISGIRNSSLVFAVDAIIIDVMEKDRKDK